MNNHATTPHMRRVTWIAVAVLFVLHQDFWFWNDRTLIAGFMPVGLAYHALFSLLAASVWALAIRFAWPAHIEQWADQEDAPHGKEDAS